MGEAAGRGIVGAVAGNVKVGNQVNLLTKWQAIEYISSQNFDRKAFAYLNAITVVPGAIGAFRKKAIEEAGGFTTDTLAEDCDLTIRILRCGYIVENDNSAIAMTEAPETLKQFFKQRFRWSYGVMQTFWKNRDALAQLEIPVAGLCGVAEHPDLPIHHTVRDPAGRLFHGGRVTHRQCIQDRGLLPGLYGGGLVGGLAGVLFRTGEIIPAALADPAAADLALADLAGAFPGSAAGLKGELQHWGVLEAHGECEGRMRWLGRHFSLKCLNFTARVIHPKQDKALWLKLF